MKLNKTGIEYLDYTWLPTHGCSHSGSPGCDNCWAKAMSIRLAGMGVKGYDKTVPFKVVTCPERLNEPLKVKKPSRIGVSFMGDLFHNDVPFEFIKKIWNIASAARQHTFLFLTKRPKRMLEFTQYMAGMDDISIAHWPRNCWLGVSCENQRTADERIPILLQIPADVRFVSVEPMLGEVDLEPYMPNIICDGCGAFLSSAGEIHEILHDVSDRFPEYCGCGKYWRGLDGIFCGCESGQNRRSVDIKHIRNLKDQCVDAGVPFFLKQMEVNGKVVKMPELDGRRWDQLPTGKGQ